MQVAVIGSVRWGMPRVAIVLAPGQNFFALLGSELSPNVAWCGHDQGYGVPALAGALVTFSASLNISQSSKLPTSRRLKPGLYTG